MPIMLLLATVPLFSNVDVAKGGASDCEVVGKVCALRERGVGKGMEGGRRRKLEERGSGEGTREKESTI